MGVKKISPIRGENGRLKSRTGLFCGSFDESAPNDWTFAILYFLIGNGTFSAQLTRNAPIDAVKRIKANYIMVLNANNEVLMLRTHYNFSTNKPTREAVEPEGRPLE